MWVVELADIVPVQVDLCSSFCLSFHRRFPNIFSILLDHAYVLVYLLLILRRFSSKSHVLRCEINQQEEECPGVSGNRSPTSPRSVRTTHKAVSFLSKDEDREGKQRIGSMANSKPKTAAA